MTEEELKTIWRTDQHAPLINYAALETSLTTANDKLRRRVKREITYQAGAGILTFIPVLFYPRLIFFALSIAALGVWYIPELARLYRQDDQPGAIKTLLDSKIHTLQRFITRTRIVMYLFTPVAIPIVLYGIGYLDNLKGGWFLPLAMMLGVYEILIVIATEIYFAVLYTPTLKKLKALRQELDAD